jgi:predicted acetyltransferase
VAEPEIVNPVDVTAIAPWLRALRRGLLADPYHDFAERVEQNRRTWHPHRTWGVRDRGQWVGTLVSLDRRMTVPGRAGATRELAVDAVSGVTVATTHRRRGLLRAMITDSLRAAKERGDAVSALIPAEYPIYGRYGYAPATRIAGYRLRVREPGATPPPPAAAGEVRHVDPADLADAAPAVFDAARRRNPGQLDRPEPWWQRTLGLDGYRIVGDAPATWVVHEGPDGIDGMLSWRVTSGFDIAESAGALRVGDLVAATDTAYQALWHHLASIDLVAEVVLTERPVEEPIRWLLPDARALQQTSSTDFLWLRLLDVPAALSARGYAVSDELVLDVVDTDGPGYGAGRFALRAGEDAECAPTNRPADLRLSQRALAATYLGGTALRQRSLIGDVEEVTAGAIGRFDTLFASAVPAWNQTWF